MIKRSTSSNSLHGKSNLFLDEKIYKLKHENGKLLNTRNELIIKRRHIHKFFV